MRKSASRENEESKANDSTVIVKTCEGTPEIESETCREPLLATNRSSGDSMYQVDFLRNSNEDVEKEKVYSTFTLNTNTNVLWKIFITVFFLALLQ